MGTPNRTPEAPGARRATAKGLALLFRSSPLGVLAMASVTALLGFAPALIAIAGGRLVTDAAAAAHSLPARRSLVVDVIGLAAGLAAMKLGVSVLNTAYRLLRYQFSAAVARVRMEAAVSFPGLAQLDDPTIADRLTAAGYAEQAGGLVNYLSTCVWRTLTLVTTAIIVGRLVWWAPLGLFAVALPAAIGNWRHAGERGFLVRTSVPELRHADHAETLAVGLAPARELRIFGLERWLVKRQADTWSEALTPVFAAMNRQLRRDLVPMLATTAAGVAPFLVVATAVPLSAGRLTTLAIGLTGLSGAVGVLQSYLGLFRGATNFLPDLFDLAELPGHEPRLRVGGRAVPAAAPARELRFESVTFRYPDSAKPVLEGLDLSLPAGESLALVGENGAGKSTIVKLLCRLYDPTAGCITWDGTDIRNFDLDEYRRRLAVLFQEGLHLPLSVTDNLAVGRLDRDARQPDRDARQPDRDVESTDRSATSATDLELLREAARQAGAEDLISGLPQGFDTILDRQFGGVEPSGGQWQRLLLARTIVSRLMPTPGQAPGRGASILVLDEPTAALDVTLEHDLFERFAALTAGLTTLLISHRFSTVRMARTVAVLEAGRVVELGSHDQLVARGGRYAHLYALQAARFRDRPAT